MLDAACAWKLGSLAFKLLATASKALDHEKVATFLEIGATSVEAGEALHDRQRDIVRAAAGRLQAQIEQSSDQWLRAEFGSDPFGTGGCCSSDSGARRYSSKLPSRWLERRPGQSRCRTDRRPGCDQGRCGRRNVPRGHIRWADAPALGAGSVRGGQGRPRVRGRNRHTSAGGAARTDRAADHRTSGDAATAGRPAREIPEPDRCDLGRLSAAARGR